MTNQQEIREGIKDNGWCDDCDYHATPEICCSCNIKIDNLLNYLNGLKYSDCPGLKSSASNITMTLTPTPVKVEVHDSRDAPCHCQNCMSGGINL